MATNQPIANGHGDRMDINKKTRKFMGLLVTLFVSYFGTWSLVIFLIESKTKKKNHCFVRVHVN